MRVNRISWSARPAFRLLSTYPCPTIASCFILSALSAVFTLTCPAITAHLLMLSILSIFLMPSQCRMSGIRAWNRMSLTPAMFSVRLK